MSLVVELGPKRETTKVGPNTTLSQVVKEVCLKWNLDPSRFGLKHNKKLLDLGLTFRFSSLPSNAKLELVPLGEGAAVDAIVTIALQLPSGERVKGEFSSSTTLLEILGKWERDLHLVANALAQNKIPVCTYLRTEVRGRTNLSATTLRDIGLLSGNGLLRYSVGEDAPVVASPVSASTPTESKPPQQLLVSSDDKTPKPSLASSQAPDQSPLPRNPTTKDAPPASNTGPLVMPHGYHIGSVPQTLAEALPDRTGTSIFSVLSPFASHQYDDNGNPISMFDAPAPRLNVNMDGPPQSMFGEPHVADYPFKDFKFPDPPAPRHAPNPDVQPMSDSSLPASSSQPSKKTEPFVVPERHALVFTLPESDTPVASTFVLPDEVFEVNVQDLHVLLADAQNAQAEGELITQAIRDKRRKEKESRYDGCVCRVYLPGKLVLQGYFHPQEKVGAVREFVCQHLRDPALPFTLYITPPRTELDDSVTLVRAGLVPTAIIRLSTEEQLGDALLADFVREHIISFDEAESQTKRPASNRKSNNITQSSAPPPLRNPEDEHGNMHTSSSSSSSSSSKKGLNSFLKALHK